MTPRLKIWAIAVLRWIGSAPLTYAWLTVLLGTTILQHQLTGRVLHTLLVHESTNLQQLAKDPLHVLFASLLWIDGKYWTPYVVLFTLFLAPAERWLGQIRWLTVGLTAHIVATYISEGVLYQEIEHHLAPERLVHARDIGVSYFLLGVMGVLTYHIAAPWRWGYAAALVALFGVMLIIKPDFTAIGHFSAIVIGTCFEPLARCRDGPTVNPATIRAKPGRSGARDRPR
jgi:hypothetical protein